MASATFDVIRLAVQQKKIIHAKYDGHRREFCPHVLGWDADGSEAALCYQFAGGSGKGLSPDGSPGNWRCIKIQRLQDVQLVDGDWHTASNYNPRAQACVARIEVKVED